MKAIKKIKNNTIAICTFLLLMSWSFQVSAQWEQAKKLIEDEDFKKAKTILQPLLGTKKPEVFYYMGLAHLEDGLETEDPSAKKTDIEAAKNYFTQGIALKGGKYPYNHIGMGRYYIYNKNFIEAKKFFDTGLELSGGGDVLVLVTIANGYLGATDAKLIDEATRLLTKAQALDNKNPRIYTSLGDVWLKQNVFELALKNYKQATEFDPKFVQGHYKVGLLNLKEKKYNEGAAAFTKAIELDANFAPAYREMGELWFRAGKYEKAKENYKKYVEKTEGDLAAEVRYAQFLYLSKDHNECINQINSVLKDTTSIVLTRLLGYSLIETKQYQKGKDQLDAYFAKMNPEYFIAQDFESYGKALDSLNQDSLAVVNFEKALTMDKERTYLYAQISDCWMTTKSYPKAAAALEKSIALKDNVKDRYYLARAYQKMEDIDKAEANFIKITEMKPDFLNAYTELSRIANKKDPEVTQGLAKPYYEKIIELTEKEAAKYTKDRIVAYQYLGFYYFDKKDNAKSLDYYKKVKELDPANKKAIEMIDYISKVEKKN